MYAICCGWKSIPFSFLVEWLLTMPPAIPRRGHCFCFELSLVSTVLFTKKVA